MAGADALENFRLGSAADDVHQTNPVLQAKLVEHLTQVRCRGHVDKSGVTLLAHGFDHPEDGQRIDEARRPFGSRNIVGQDEASGSRYSSVFAIQATPARATVLPMRTFAWSPVATTTPAPSLPTVIGTPRRPAMARRPASGIAIVVRRDDPSPVVFAVEISAAPNNSPRSDGLTGAASIRTTTSCRQGRLWASARG